MNAIETFNNDSRGKKKNRVVSLVLIDAFVLLGISYATAGIFYGLFFIISPLVVIFSTWFFYKPSRIFALSGGRFISILRILLILILGYSVFSHGVPMSYDAGFSQDQTIRNRALETPLSTLIQMFLAPILYFITLIEFFGGVLLLLKFSRTRNLEYFNKNTKIPLGEAAVYATAVAMCLFWVFFIFVYMEGYF